MAKAPVIHQPSVGDAYPLLKDLGSGNVPAFATDPCDCCDSDTETGTCACCGGIWSTRITKVTIAGLSNNPEGETECNEQNCGTLNATLSASTYLHCQSAAITFLTGTECGEANVLCDSSGDVGGYGSIIIRKEGDVCTLVVSISMESCLARQQVDFLEWSASVTLPTTFDCVDGVVVCNLSSAGDNFYCLEAGSTATVEFGVP